MAGRRRNSSRCHKRSCRSVQQHRPAVVRAMRRAGNTTLRLLAVQAGWNISMARLQNLTLQPLSGTPGSGSQRQPVQGNLVPQFP